MKYFLSIIFVLTVLGSGCLAQSESHQTAEVVTNEAESAMVDAIQQPEEDSGPSAASVTVIDPNTKVVEMSVGNYFFNPASIAVETGQVVTVKFLDNIGEHTFVIDELDLQVTVQAGEEITFIAPKKAGMYYFYCDIGDHRERGMEGVLHVKEL